MELLRFINAQCEAAGGMKSEMVWELWKCDFLRRPMEPPFGKEDVDASKWREMLCALRKKFPAVLASLRASMKTEAVAGLIAAMLQGLETPGSHFTTKQIERAQTALSMCKRPSGEKWACCISCACRDVQSGWSEGESHYFGDRSGKGVLLVRHEDEMAVIGGCFDKGAAFGPARMHGTYGEGFERYCGQMRGGVPNGNGCLERVFFALGERRSEIFRGVFSHGLRNGPGMECAGGAEMTGRWRQNERHGMFKREESGVIRVEKYKAGELVGLHGPMSCYCAVREALLPYTRVPDLPDVPTAIALLVRNGYPKEFNREEVGSALADVAKAHEHAAAIGDCLVAEEAGRLATARRAKARKKERARAKQRESRKATDDRAPAAEIQGPRAEHKDEEGMIVQKLLTCAFFRSHITHARTYTRDRCGLESLQESVRLVNTGRLQVFIRLAGGNENDV